MTHDIHLAFDSSVTAEEVIGLRSSEGEQQQHESVWQDCIDRALVVATAREVGSNALIGVSFVVGNARHAELVDLYVHPKYRKEGLGGNLVDMCTEFVREKGILYYGLTSDKSYPWLEGFYEKHGFRKIDFAMWHEDALKNVKN